RHASTSFPLPRCSVGRAHIAKGHQPFQRISASSTHCLARTRPCPAAGSLDAVKSRGPVLYDGEAGHRNNSLAHLSLIAIALQRPLSWDPNAERFPNDPEANAQLRPIRWHEPWDQLLKTA